jgi:putative phosphoribosyl transferase
MSMQALAPREVSIGARRLQGLLRLPEEPTGLVIFAHGSGSSRFSRRNTFVAGELGRHGLATLLFDLLTDEESGDRRNVFDIALLGERVLEAIEWAPGHGAVASLPLGLFGASTGAAAALVAAAQRPADVGAVVSRGGRPDLAGDSLPAVRAPTLLIVGGADYRVIELNEQAAERLACERSIAIVPGATHLFEEPGTLERVVELASEWFLRHLARSPVTAR